MSTPTTADLDAQIVAGIESAISQTVPLFPKAFVRVLAKVLSGPLVLLYRYVGFMLLQQYVTTATIRETTVNGTKIKPLVELGKQFGAGEPEDASHAELVVSITVLTQVGSLPGGQLFSRDETGVLYALIAPVLLDAATVQGTVKAASDQDGGDGSGAIGNLAVGDALSIVSAPAQVDTEATVVSVAVVGENAEEQEPYRERVLFRTQRKPQGGAKADYRAWSEIVPGVEQVYVYKREEPGPGGVDVYVLATTEVDPDGVPTQELLDAVFDAIELDEDGLANNRPTNDLVNTLPIVRLAFDVIVGGLIADDEADGLAQIDAAVDEWLRSREPYIVGLSVLPRKDRVTVGGVAGVVHDIASAEGATVATVTLQYTGNTIVAYTLAPGEMAKLGSDDS